MNEKLKNSKYSTISTLPIAWGVELIKNSNNGNNQPLQQ